MKQSRCRMMWSLILTVVVTLSLFGVAQESNDWIRTYEGTAYGAFFDIVQVDGDRVLVTGATYHSQSSTRLGEVLIAELSMDGDIVWEKRHGREAHDQGLYLEPTVDGGYLILGETESFGEGGRDLYVLRVDEQGELLQEWTYGGAGTEWAKDLVALEDGGFLLIGETNSFTDSFDVYVIRLDSEGNEVWETTLDMGHNESGTAALEAANGELLVLAVVSYAGGSSGAYRDSRLFRLDRNGDELWSVLYRGADKQAGDAMSWTSDGDIVIAGLSEKLSLSTSVFDFWLARVDGATGELQWSLAEGSQYADDYGIAMSEESDGKFVVAGLGPGFPILEFTESGIVLRRRTAGPDTVIYGGFSVLALEDGSYLIPGFKYLLRSGDMFDAVLLRYGVD